MPIKKSSFEKKWYYRVAKVFVLAAPLIAAIIAIFTGFIDVAGIKDDFAAIGATAFFESNKWLIGFIVVSVAGYYIVVNVIWKVFLYIAFGGMVDDTMMKPVAVKGARPAVVAAAGNNADVIKYMKETAAKRADAWIWIILIILFIWIAIYNGSLWYSSCTHKCYSSRSDCSATSSACNGNVICRQCPN
jgi:uncharacterized membrane protein